MPVLAVLLPALLAAVLWAGLRQGFLLRLTRRPIWLLGIALIIGFGLRLLDGAEVPLPIAKIFAQAMLGMLAFLACLECRLSRLKEISADGFSLATTGTLVIMIGFAATAFILVPGLGLYPPLLLGAALMLGSAPGLTAPLLTAPIEMETKTASRVEAAAVLTFGVPIAVMLNAGAMPLAGEVNLSSLATIRALSGFATGGAIGLLAARFIQLSDKELPLEPLLIAGFVYFGAVLLGYDPVMAMAGAGLTYSAEIKLPAATRTRFWRTGEAVLMPPSLFLFGLLIAPYAVTFDFLVWLMALIAVGLVRPLARNLVLSGTSLHHADRSFLVWSNGAPGVASGLMLVLLVASEAPLSDRAIALAAAAILIGIVSTRAASKALTRRLVQQTAIARKQRYSPA